MEKLIRFNYIKLRNEAHVEFHDALNKSFDRYAPADLGIQSEYDSYRPLYDAEVSVLDVMRKSGYTDEIDEQDHRRDRIFRGFADAVASAANHFNPEKRSAALKLQTALDHYGNIAAKALDQETAAIDDLLRELNGSDSGFPEQIETLDLGDWLTQLDADNQTFKELMQARYGEKAKRPATRMKSTRLAVDKAYREILAQLDALARVNGEDDYKDAAGELNAIAERYKNILAQEKGQRNAKKTDKRTNE
ncbi:hypothetical protein FACS189430_00930 [Bacteroidia bacterium]|nr:hypothetical protein FACS189430_00930 [Bacteroidia bacterium]